MRVNVDTRAKRDDLEALGDYRAEFDAQALSLRAIWNRPEAHVAFGGHFSCGKSTLLSALIQRDILPVGDLPETGVPCRLRQGLRDSVHAVGPGNVMRVLPWTSTAIAEQIGLYTQDGARRPAENMPDRLDIEVDCSAIGPGAIWIDTPGINDDPTVTERALALALDADMLVWVLSSRQCFSEPEVAFLERFMEMRGPNALTFVLNVFLPRDELEDWERFNRREGAVLRERIAKRLAELGAADAPLHIVSARASTGVEDDGFGGADLRGFLSAIVDSNVPVVRRSRRQRIERVTGTLRADLVPRLDQAQALLQQELKREKERRERATARDACSTAVAKVLDDAYSSFSRSALSAAQRVGDRIATDDLKRDNSYGNALKSLLEESISAAAICDRFDTNLDRYGWTPLGSAKRKSIVKALTVEAVSVSVPNTPVKGSTIAKTAAAVGIGAAFFTGGLSLLITGAAAAAGGIAGGIMSSNEALLQDVALTRARLREAAEGEHRRLQGKREFILRLVGEGIGPIPDALPEKGRAQVAALMALNASYEQLSANLSVCPETYLWNH